MSAWEDGADTTDRSDRGPACPETAERWLRKGCSLGRAARMVAENDDVRVILTDEDACPVSVGLLAMIYGVPLAIARKAVIHWLRRPGG